MIKRVLLSMEITAERGVFLASCPELNDVTIQGETVKEAEKMFKMMLERYFEIWEKENSLAEILKEYITAELGKDPEENTEYCSDWTKIDKFCRDIN